MAVTDENGNPLEYYGVTRLIDDRKKLEAALKESDEKFTAITKNSHDLIWICDAKTMQFTFQSESGEKIYGYTREEMVNANVPFSDFYDDKTNKLVENIIKEKTEQFKRGEIDKFTFVFEGIIIHKDGHPV
jgi:PAS domain S-box-containing protein